MKLSAFILATMLGACIAQDGVAESKLDVVNAAAVPTPCNVTIDPPDVSTNNIDVSCLQTRDNVLQAAINAATAGDVICMNPGKYYTACLTHVNKPLTIRGACSGVSASSLDLSFNATTQTRTGCSAAGETVWIASNTKGDSNGGLQGIFVDSSDVTIDGIAFYEESMTFRRMVGILCGAPAGNYDNIKVLNNYMKGYKISADCQIGGPEGSQFPKTITNLEYTGNFIKADFVNNWEPLGFRGYGYTVPETSGITLTNLKITDNKIGCKGPGPHTSSCTVINLHNSVLNGNSSISGNDFFENTAQVCPINTGGAFDSDIGGAIHDGWDNTNAGTCAAYSSTPSSAPSTAPSTSAAPSVSLQPSLSKSSKAMSSGKSDKAVTSGKSQKGPAKKFEKTLVLTSLTIPSGQTEARRLLMKDGPYELFLECGDNGPVIKVQAAAGFNEATEFYGQVSDGQVSGSTNGANAYTLWQQYNSNKNDPFVGAVTYIGVRSRWTVAVEGSSFVGNKDGNKCEFAGNVIQGSVIV